MTEPASELHKIVLNAHDIAPATRDHYLRDLDQWIAFAGMSPKGWTRRKAAEFYNSLLARPMKPQSANRLMAGIAYASRWWAHYENDEKLDFAHVQTARAKGQKVQEALSEDEARRLLETCDKTLIGIRDFALLVVGLETGMRRMSLESMTIEDTLLGPSTRSPYPAAFVELKGKDPTWVPLSDVAVLALRPWLADLDYSGVHEGPLFRPFRRHVGKRTTTLIAEAKQLSRSAIGKIFDERAAAAGLRHINPHLLRHTFVTWRAAAGLAPHEIAAITHHDLGKAIGTLGGYMDARAIGGQVRNRAPAWLADLVAERCKA